MKNTKQSPIIIFVWKKSLKIPKMRRNQNKKKKFQRRAIAQAHYPELLASNFFGGGMGP